MAGTWSGTVRDNTAGDGRLEFRFLSVSGDAVQGRWAMVMADRYQLSGSFSGTTSGSRVVLRSTSLDYTMAEPPYFLCQFEWTGSITGTRLTGTHRSSGCTQASIEGTFDVGR